MGRWKRAKKLRAATTMKLVNDTQAERVPAIFNVSEASPVACLPSTEVAELHATYLETPPEISQNLQEGWISVMKNRGKHKELISQRYNDWTAVPSWASSPVTVKPAVSTVNQSE